ncbi:SHOCT domain-containing protein [Glutamicibacter arilaitensis]|uniref:SHOCT domain-containing protein n=1 Tax=Glutamicibacter arilaitensis TaxID=256701 RepID=UPI0038514AF6
MENTEVSPRELAELAELNDAVPFGYIEDDSVGGTGFLDTLLDAVPITFGILVALFVVIAAAATYIIIRNFKSDRRAVSNNFPPQTDPAIWTTNSQLVAPNKNLAQKLAELDDLLARGLITREEYSKARSKALLE